MSPGRPQGVYFLAERRMQAEQPIEKVGAELRSMMSWLKEMGQAFLPTTSPSLLPAMPPPVGEALAIPTEVF